LRKLELFELDDLGYVQQIPERCEVLFTLIAERYQRRSPAVTSDLVFRQRDRIFNDQTAIAAAIDRLVHHAAILEFDVASYRADQARCDTQTAAPPRSKGRPPVSVPKRERKR
jgi:DNA replication protein DnaC